MEISKLLELIHELEKLKSVLRHCWMKDWRQESVAEHTWRITFMAILIAPNLSFNVNLEKVLIMCTIHDLWEILTWDIPAFKKDYSIEFDSEKEYLDSLKNTYSSDIMDKIYEIRLEYENQQSIEAKFVKSLDKIEVRIQHNESDISTWNEIEFVRSLFAADKYCEFDDYLKQLNELVKDESSEKIISESQKNIFDIKKEANRLKNAS